MKWNILSLFLLWTTVKSQKQPHILFIMADDMGWNDVSFHGSDQIQTPNIDSLAYNGVILKQYYSEAVCTPARTALLTGKYPLRLGMQGLPLYNSEDRGIPLTERLLPSYLKELGYKTHLVGKWHVGMSREEYLPMNRGYDTHYGMRGGFIDYYTYNKIEQWPDGRLMFGLDLFDGNNPQDKEQRYIVDALTDRALNIIKDHNTSHPLFLHVTHNAPHAGNDGGALQPPLYGSVKNRHIANSDRRLYADVVSHLDQTVGDLVKALDQKNILKDTIIIFVSDNGAPTVGQFKNWGSNLPFRGKKYTPWEGGVRVPAIIWHSNIKSNVWDGLMHITDWLPTLVNAAGGNFDVKIDGVDQWDSINNGVSSKRSDVLVAVDDNNNNTYAAYRAGDYKMVIGNVTGLSNGYYSTNFMVNKESPPDYHLNLVTSATWKTLASNGFGVDMNKVIDLRQGATVRQQDFVKDSILCEPNLAKGCLFNVRRDPMEAHDIWNEAPKIVTILSTKLRSLWNQQLRRGPPALHSEANPANFDYTWMPWIPRTTDFDYSEDNSLQENYFLLNENLQYPRDGRNISAKNCAQAKGLRQFICILSSVF